jgi:uncharacterized protein YecE (DUF72 family)
MKAHEDQVDKSKIYIGTSGWHYAHWVGPFYPEDAPPDAFLAYYARKLRSVEINHTFYQLPDPATLAKWRDSTPAGFLFACKASRYITHMKKLKDPAPATRRFFDAVTMLGNKLGPILFQLPPRWCVDADRLTRFLEALPERLRFAFEFRDESWFTPRICELLARHNAALCAYDLDRRRSPVKVTASFVYVRLHGPDGPYRGQYDGWTLCGWARRFLTWSKAGLDIYCYLDNDELGYAAQDAMRLAEMVADRSTDAGS